jgi:chromosomal replication initiator protein
MKDSNNILNILQEVSTYTGVSVEKILSNSRKANIVRARHITMWICRYYSGLSLQKIANILQCKRHATVIHGATQTENMFFTEKNLKEDLKAIISKINR